MANHQLHLSKRAEHIIQKTFNNLTFSEKIKPAMQSVYFWNTPPLQAPRALMSRLSTRLNLSVPSVLLSTNMNNVSIDRKKSYRAGTQNPNPTFIKLALLNTTTQKNDSKTTASKGQAPQKR